MKDMPERDLVPKNMMKVPEVYSLYCRSSYKHTKKGRKREGGEEGRGRGGGCSSLPPKCGFS